MKVNIGKNTLGDNDKMGKLEENEVWFATVGQMLVSDGAFGTKEEQQQQRPKGRPKRQRESRER